MPITSPTTVLTQVVIGPASAGSVFTLLTDPQITPYFFNFCAFQSDFKVGSRYTLTAAETLMADGEILEFNPPFNLLMTFKAHWDPQNTDPPSRVRFVLTPRPPLCEVSVIHDQLVAGSQLVNDLSDNWLIVLSALKTLYETEKPLPLREEFEIEQGALIDAASST